MAETARGGSGRGGSGRARSVRTRITAVAVAVVAVLLVVGAAGTVWMLDRLLTDHVATLLDEDVEIIAEWLEEDRPASIVERDDVLVALHLGGRLIVNDEDAKALPRPDEVRRPTEVGIDEERYLALAGDGIVVARSLEDVDEAVSAAATVLAVSVPIGVAVLGAVVRFVVSRALAPVDRIRRQVDHVSADSLDQRVPRTGNGDEIDRLASTMNRMLDRVEDGYRTRQRFASDASHELRSPLATMRQYAELARAHPGAAPPEELAEVVLSEGARMQDIVEGLLLLAKLDEGAVRATAASDVDLDDLLLAEAGRVRALGDVAVDGSGIAPVRVRGEARLLARAVRNVVDNAVRHARSRIALSAEHRGGLAILHIDDDGSGVPEAQREHVFERFARLDEARSRDTGGSGLGLAIVGEIVQAHGGSATVADSPLGGARFTLSFPAAADGAEPAPPA